MKKEEAFFFFFLFFLFFSFFFFVFGLEKGWIFLGLFLVL